MFKRDELVLISDGNGGFNLSKVVTCYHSEEFNADGYLLNFGHYNSFYKTESIHKCPASIKKLVKEKS